MILNKQVGVFLNLVHFQFKQFLSKVFQNHGFNLTPEQFLVMDTLWDEGVLSQQQIANILIKDKNSITKLIDSLERKGLVVRETGSSDKRVKMIHLTEKAIIIKEDLTLVALKSTDEIIKDIPNEELISFIKVLNKMSSNMSRYINQYRDNR